MIPLESPLTRENYHEFKEYQGKSVIHASCLHHIYPGQGGSIKRLLNYFEQEKAEDKPHQSLGKLFHKYLENKKDFVVSPDDRPEPGICAIVDELFAKGGFKKHVDLSASGFGVTIDLIAVKSHILSIAREQGYQPNWKDDTIVNKVIEKGQKYFDFLISAQGYYMLTSKQKEQFEGMSKSVLDSPWAEQIFRKDAEREVPVLFKVIYDGVEIWCKALLDWVLVPESPQDIVVIDFKTTSKPVGIFMTREGIKLPTTSHEFIPGPYYEYRYYRQLVFYKRAAQELFLQRNPGWKKRIPITQLNILPIESLAPYELNYILANYSSITLGEIEINSCFSIIANHYKTLKKY